MYNSLLSSATESDKAPESAPSAPDEESTIPSTVNDSSQSTKPKSSTYN